MSGVSKLHAQMEVQTVYTARFGELSPGVGEAVVEVVSVDGFWYVYNAGMSYEVWYQGNQCNQ